MTISRLIPLVILAAVLVAACDGTEPSNAAPTAAFTAQCNLLACTLTNASTDADGRIVAYHWDFGDHSEHATTRDAAHAYAAPGGQYTVTLTVTDNDGEATTATRTVSVREANVAPTARFIASCDGLTCAFTNQSVDGNAGDQLTFDWDFGDHTTHVRTRHPTHTYATPGGQYLVTLTATDNAGERATVTEQVAVSPNVPPTANFSYTCTELVCRFSDLSGDTDGYVFSYSWDFGDGQRSTEANPEHTYAINATFTVRLTVTDDWGATASVSYQVTVPSGQSYWPAAAFSVSCAGVTCTFTDESTPAGSVGYWFWDFGDGTTSTDPNPVHDYDVTEPTTFTVVLGVADWWFEGGSQVSHTITVVP